MALCYQVGDPFPSIPLEDDRGNKRSIAELADGQPLILIFYRGPW